MFRYLLNHVLPAGEFIERVAKMMGVYDTQDLSAIIETGLDDGSLSIFPVGEGKDSRLFIKNGEVEFKGKTVPRLQRDSSELRRRAIEPIGMIGCDELSLVYTEAVNYLSGQKYVPNKVVLETASALAEEGFFDKRKNRMELFALSEFKTFGTGEYMLPMFPDFRFRIYTDCGGIASYQGGDLHRAVCDFAQRLPATDENIHVFLEVIEREYGVTEKNYRKILADPKKFIRTATKKGRSKPFCTLRAAEAVREMKEDGVSGYILQQDQSASGPAIYGWFTGDESLCRLTNLYPSKAAQSLYTAMAELVKKGDLLPPMVRDNPLFWDRKTAKTFAMPMVYSAANPSLTRGAILSKPKKSKIQFLDKSGNYIAGSLEAASSDDLNSRYAGAWKAMGWDLAIRVASDVARAYEASLFGSKMVGGLTTRLRPAMMAIKDANRKLRKDGRIMNWTSPSGCRVVNRAIRTNRDDIRDVRLKGHRVSFYPVEEVPNTDAAASPNLIHSVDASVVHFMAIAAKERGFCLAPIHDSFGSHIGNALWVRDQFKTCMMKVPTSWLNQTLIASKHDPLPYEGIDIKRFKKSRFCLS